MTTRVRSGGIASNTISNSMLHTSFSVDSDLIAPNAVGPTELNLSSNYTFTGSLTASGATTGFSKVVNVTRWTSANFNGSTSNTSYFTLDTLSLTATPGNLIHVIGDMPTRGTATGWALSLLRWNDQTNGIVWGSTYNGTNGSETIMSIPVTFSYIWPSAATHDVQLQFRSYDGTRYYGTSNGEGSTTTPVFTIYEIAQ